MKKLLSTTALAIALGFPALALSQSATTTANTSQTQTRTQTQQGETMRGFLATRGQSDVLASDLIGHDVYAPRTAADMTRTDDRARTNADGTPRTSAMDSSKTGDKANMRAGGTHGMTTMSSDQLDRMEKIGEINEVVLSQDGQVRALVISVGGFLGMGDHDVAVTMDQVRFAADADDRSEMYIVVNTSADTLKDAPAYDRMTRNDTAVTRTDRRMDNSVTRDGRSALTAPAITRDGYKRVEAKQVSSETLVGKTVYDVNDNDVGEVTEIIIDDSGTIKDVIIDFGGFLGMGESQVSLAFDQLTILSDGRGSDVRVYVDGTKDQIQNMPKYQARK